MTPTPRKKAPANKPAAKKEAKPNGKDPGVTSIEAAREKKAKDGPPQIWDRAPSQEEIVHAEKLLNTLKGSASDMGDEAVIDALVQIVDVHPNFRMPATWPVDAKTTLVEAPILEEIGKLLLRGCPKLEVSPMRVRFLWRNKKTWTVKGVAVHAQAKKLSELSRFYSKGAVAAVVANYQVFRLLNTRQKLRAIYHALRELDAEGTIKPPQFEGFFDEIELFGTGTNQTDAYLARAMERGGARKLPWTEQPDFFEEGAPGNTPEQKAAAANA